MTFKFWVLVLITRRCLRFYGLPLTIMGTGIVSLPAFALDGGPFGVYLGQTQIRDDNVFRAPGGFGPSSEPIADTISSTYVGITFDTEPSAQYVHIDLSVNDNRYRKLDQLNNTGSRYQAGWKGEIGSKFKVDASWNRNQSLANFSDYRFTTKNSVTNESELLRLQYSITPDGSFYMSGGNGRTINSAVENSISDSRTQIGEFGARYLTPLGNSISVLSRISLGRYPNRQILPGSIVDNSYRQQDYEGNIDWSPSVPSRFNFRVAQTERMHNDIPQRNYSGFTGGVSWDWSHSEVSAVKAYWSRDLGATEYYQANYSVVRTFGLAPRWVLTPKISLQGLVERRNRSFGGNPQFSLASLPVATDVTRLASLSAQYAANSNIQLTINLRRETRTSSDPVQSYKSSVVALGLQLMF